MEYSHLPAFPLEFGKNGESYVIERLTMQDTKVKAHMHDIGFVSGAIIFVESMNKHGMIVRINDSKLALDRDICNNIYVKEYIKEDDIAER